MPAASAAGLLTPGKPSMTWPKPSQPSGVFSGKQQISEWSLKLQMSSLASKLVNTSNHSLHAPLSLQPGSGASLWLINRCQLTVQADSPDICKASAGAGCWGSLRTGMRLLLVGRAGQAQRHGALQAAALFQQLCATPAWLLGSSGRSTQVTHLHILYPPAVALH